jgi:hypothetical protein
MNNAGQILKGISLVWWPTILHSISESSAINSGRQDRMTTILDEFSGIMNSEDADALEELTLP